MFRYSVKPDQSRQQASSRLVQTPLWPLALLLAVGLAREADAAPPPEPFKVANIHFETNASACDMGIQIIFDTDGITDGFVKSPKGQMVYQFRAKGGMQKTGGQTEGFLEGIEPQIEELLDALGCEPSDEEEVIALDELLGAFPAGDYTFKGKSHGARFEDQATLNHLVPAGPAIQEPDDGEVFPDAALVIDWDEVTGAIIPALGPIDGIIGYHVIVVETGGEALPQLDVDVPDTETSVTVPGEYLKPGTIYQFEVLATENGGNQTISEGFFCTAPIAPIDCELP